ncbi:MAG: hypothetical protein RIB43_16730, partial [Rhodospirillaceae bacterium]
QQAAHNAGIDMAQYTAGSQVSRVNPETGLEEFSVECADEGGCRQEPDGYRGPNIYDFGGTTYVNVTDTSSSPTGGYDAFSADNWAGGPGGSGTGGSVGGGSGSGGVPYGPEPEDDDPNNKTVAEPIDTVVHRFVYDENGNLVPKQPGVTSYDPSQFSGIGVTPQVSGPGNIQVAGGGWPDWARLPKAWNPHYGEPALAPPEIPFDEIPANFGLISDGDLIHRIRYLKAQRDAVVGIGGLLAPAITGRPIGAAAPRAFELQKILDAHLAECGNRSSCNPDAWRDYLEKKD